jgi:arginase
MFHIKEEAVQPMKGKVSIIRVPLMLGANRRGIEKGPGAILRAGLPAVLTRLGYSVHVETEVEVPKPERKTREPDGLRNLSVIRQVNQSLSEAVSDVMTRRSFPLVLGGDHSIAIGSIAGVSKHVNPLGVIWVDAHGDMNTHRTTPSGNIHGMSLAASIGAGYPLLTALGGTYRKIDRRNAVLVGVRSLDPGELLMIRKLGIHLYTMEDICRKGIQQVMKEALIIAGSGTQGIHLSFDLDVMEPAIAPGVSTIVPDGLSEEEATWAVDYLYRSGLIRSAEYVELNPARDLRRRTERLAVKLIGSMFGAGHEEAWNAII